MKKLRYKIICANIVSHVMKYVFYGEMYSLKKTIE